MSSGQTVVRKPLFSKSNVELIKALRVNFSHQAQYHQNQTQAPSTDQSGTNSPSDYTQWTTVDGDTLEIPTWRPTPLTEPRDSYDVTVKLFYLPNIPSSRRSQHTKEAIDLVLKELGIESIDLLIVSYPGVSFDADDYGEEEDSSVDNENASLDSTDESQGLEAQLKAWRTLEEYHERGVISQLGVSEFSSERLDKFLPEVKVRPTVNQINVKDCCVVPQPLIVYAKENQLDLLTHADCTDILPPGTTRELLGPGKDGAGIIASKADAGDEEPGLKGDIEPQWVIKYTAVVKNRGVIENKGYFALAQLGTCIESRPEAAQIATVS
ncbi:hypothetical protein B0A52_00384 [Exophiala mesophila]|uniref:GCS light chain n=1 Tax=Exophiala mesophila TaxID=212818 RepID=A0A438NJW6_EXOME|nr:hypothetical protein B0A52_00384 [Exophiala mesophila]